MNERTKRLFWFFLFAFSFMTVWDYFVLRPKREAMRSQAQRVERVERREVKSEKAPETILPSKTAEIDFGDHAYVLDLERASVYSLKDHRHKAEPKGHIIMPHMSEGLALADPESKTLEAEGFTVKFDENYTLHYNLKDKIPFRITTPITEEGRYTRKDLLVKTKSGEFKKIPYKGANIRFLADTLAWFGLRSRYYVVALTGFKGEVVSYKDGNRITFDVYPSTPHSFKVFFGPAEKKSLSSFNPPLTEAFDLGGGWLGIIVWPMYWALVLFHRITGNYALAIVLFALVLKVLLSPLYISMYRAGKKMKELQPKLKKLQKLYKDDPERLQWETMKLYREAGVNPLSGCLPMLLMLPIFWGLYQVLQNAIELKGTAFLWVPDLSAKDPFYALPIIMGLVSAANTWFQPGADQNAKRMGLIMSAVFVFIFLTLPAGIVLYWLAYSLFGVVEQLTFRRILKV